MTLRPWKSSDQEHRGFPWSWVLRLFSTPPPLNASAFSAMERSGLPPVLSSLASCDTTLSWFLFFLLGVPFQWPQWPCSSHTPLPLWEPRPHRVVSWEQFGVTQRGHLQSPKALAMTRCVVFSDTTLTPNLWVFFWYQIHTVFPHQTVL